jgi:hypothetical protein
MSEPANKADIQRVTDAVESLAGTIQAATEQQTAVLRDFVDLIERHRETSPQISTSGGDATIQVNAGGVALWACATACGFMLMASVFLGLVVFWFAIKTNDQGHQMNAVYMSVPGLRELVEKQMQQNQSITDQEGAQQ